MSKRIKAVLLACIISISILVVPTSAAEARESSYLTSYMVSLAKGLGSGQLDVVYQVKSVKLNLTGIGVSKIQIYTSSGTLYRTIYGTTINGLMKSSGTSHSGVYTITCTPDTSYYCVVTVIAKDSNGSDTRQITTSTVKTPA